MVWSLLCCAWLDAPLEVHAVTPVQVHRGEVVTVHGQGFEAPIAIELASGDLQHTAQPVIDDPRTLRFEVPRIPPGSWDLVVRNDREAVRTALDILPDPEEVPCARGYQANTELSLPEGVAVVVRFFPDGRQERVRTLVSDIEAIEYSRRDGPCSAIHLRRTDGTRLLFEDGVKPLDERATTLGAYLGKPVEGVPGPAQ